MNRRDQYADFLWMLAKLFMYARARDIIFKGHEWWRSFEKAAENARRGVGIKNSRHCYSLALDIYIVGKTGKEVYLGQNPAEFKAYKILGDYWKSIGGVWGGDFKERKDVYHFEYPGRPL